MSYYQRAIPTLSHKNLIVTSWDPNVIAYLDDLRSGRPAVEPTTDKLVRIRQDGSADFVDLPLRVAVARILGTNRSRVATVELRRYQSFKNIAILMDGKFCHYFPTNVSSEPWLVELAAFLGADEKTLAVMRGEKTTEAVEPAETPAEAPVEVVGEDGHHAEEVAVVVDTAGTPKKGKRGGDSEKKEG